MSGRKACPLFFLRISRSGLLEAIQAVEPRAPESGGLGPGAPAAPAAGGAGLRICETGRCRPGCRADFRRWLFAEAAEEQELSTLLILWLRLPPLLSVVLHFPPIPFPCYFITSFRKKCNHSFFITTITRTRSHICEITKTCSDTC